MSSHLINEQDKVDYNINFLTGIYCLFKYKGQKRMGQMTVPIKRSRFKALLQRAKVTAICTIHPFYWV